jgi:predicted phosphatase
METIINGLKQIKNRVDSGTITTVNGTETLLSKQLEELLKEAINYTHCCTEFADGKCRPMVNADWTYLRCECGKRFKPKG